MKPPLAGCSLDFMCPVQKLLAKRYGEKMLEEVGMNQPSGPMRPCPMCPSQSPGESQHDDLGLKTSS